MGTVHAKPSLTLTDRRWPPLPGPKETERINSVLQSGKWTDGPWTAAAEQALQDLTGAPYAVAFNSCTSAIHAALIALGAHRGATVTVPSLTFAGTVTGASHIGAQLEFTDVDPGTLNAVPAPAPVAIAVDLHGVPHTGPRTFTSEGRVLTDACQSLGSRIRGEHVGADGTHAWSFSPAKLVAAPDGGAVTTTDLAAAVALRELRDYGLSDTGHGRANEPVKRHLGHNWRPSEVTMAMVTHRLALVAGWADRARQVTARLDESFASAGLWRQLAPPDTEPAWHKVRFGPPGLGRDASLNLEYGLAGHGVPTHRWGILPLHRHPAFRPLERPHLPVTDTAAAGTLCLGTETCPPMTWTDDEVEQVCHVIETTTTEG